MKRTTKYQLGYFEEGDLTSSEIEMQRWETLDAQLYSLFAILGNGILDGWNILPSSGLSVAITPGSGHVNFVSVESTDTTTLAGLTPSQQNFIYVNLTTSSYWDKSVSFTASTYLTTDAQPLYLGYANTNSTAITEVNMDNRAYLGFISLIRTLVADHRHIGGDGNPLPVNLASEVQGIINQNNLPDMDASIIQTGTIDQARLSQIDHISKLINQGTLTHAQLDSFVESLSINNATLMGETSTIDLLQLIMALKHIYPDIDEYLVNEIAYIPGISPDNYVDWDNTTAVVDIRTSAEGGEHTITGQPAPAKKAYTYTWDSESEFKSDTYSNVLIDGNQVCLDTQEETLVIDEFTDLSKWQVVTDDSSSLTIALASDPSTYVVPPASAKLVINNTAVEISLNIKREFDAQDWSQYKKLVFFLKTDSVQHGDIYFNIRDAFAGTQNSYTKVLDRNESTVNIDTLQNGWQEITIDISSYTRTNINYIAFSISSQDGWDTSKPFDFNLDSIYLTTGNKYKENGYVRVIFGQDFLYDFWRLRWDAQIPTDTQSAGLIFKGRTRVGNTLADLNQSIWSSYTSVSGTDISLPAPNLYKYIEIEMYFGASTDLSRTAYLNRIYLDYYALDVDASFNYNTKDDWDSGNKFNIDTASLVNSMSISKTEDINDIIYGSEGNVYQLDDDLVELYDITGSMLPRGTYQVLNNLQPSLGLITGVSRGNNGNIWVSDTDNDRVLELDQSGSLVTGFYGSFVNIPVDNYGIEDSGPGSNIVDLVNVASSSNTVSLGATLEVLQSIYNSNDGVLYVVFNDNLENIYDPANSLNINKIYLKIGTQKVYLNDSKVELLGIDEVKYSNWVALTTSKDSSAQFINQFSFKSNVLKITMNGADKTLLSYMVDQKAPSIVILSPYEQQRLTSNVTVKFNLYNFVLGTGVGGNAIRVTLDGGTPQDIYVNEITYSGLSNGAHTIKAQLVNADSTLNTNIEAIANGSFVVYNGTYSLPYISIQSPRPNQIYTSSPIVVDFDVENFPILATGQHLRYKIDSGAAVDYYSEDPIVVEGLLAGSHTIQLYLVDKRGDVFSPPYTYGSVTANFIVGTNSNAITKLYVNNNAIYNNSKNITTADSITYVDVGNIYFANIYSPIDVQVIPAETSKVNLSGLPSIVVAKLRSPSWVNGLGRETNVAEFVKRIQEAANATSSNVSSYIIPTPELIYGTKYLDGHSVVQLDMEGNVIMSNNAAVFAKTKEEAKNILGSAEKLGDGEFLIGDSYNKRAIITATDLDTQKSKIEWQYDTDRYISDFHIVLQDDVVISIRDDAIVESNIFIRQGTNVIWSNDSASPISIYSGKTSYDQFQLDPDLTLYGDEFSSTVLNPGDRYSFKFVTVGEYDWFAYNNILTGKVTVTKNRISSRDEFIILENDGLESPFSSRVVKVDNYGNILFSFGESYLVNPRDARPLLNDQILIST
jgi:hypothetical protein